MKKTAIFLSTILFLLSSCESRQAKALDNEVDGQHKDLVEEQSYMDENYDTIIVNYYANKELLNIFLLLPDSAFQYFWFGKYKERKKWYNEIKSNNFYSARFFYQSNFTTNSLCVHFGDGYWTMSVYKTSDNSVIVITNFVAGDGKDIHVFEVKNNKIIANLSFESLFGNYLEILKLNNLPIECNEKFVDYDITWFHFDFSDENIIEITGIPTKEEYSACLKGNTIVYKFNPESKKFDIEKIYWKDKKTNNRK